MPQIDQIGTIYASQLVWLLLVFAIIYFVIGRWMLPQIEGTIHARADKIEGDIAAAEQARAEAASVHDGYTAEMDGAHRAAHDAVQAAKDGAVKDAEIKLRAAHDDVARQIDQAEAVLADARARAMGEIEGVAADAVRDIVARLSGADVSEGDALVAVRASMAA